MKFQLIEKKINFTMIKLHCFFLIMKPNSVSKYLDQCTIHESYSLNEVFDVFAIIYLMNIN